VPSLSDHVRRDAQHAARSDIRVAMMKFVRRLDEDAKAHIESANPAEVSDGEQLGREAAAKAIANYLGPAEPHAAIDVGEPTDESSEGS